MPYNHAFFYSLGRIFPGRGQGVSLSSRDSTSSSSSLLSLRLVWKSVPFLSRRGYHILFSLGGVSDAKSYTPSDFLDVSFLTKCHIYAYWPKGYSSVRLNVLNPREGSDLGKKKIKFYQHSRSHSKATGQSHPILHHPRKPPFIWFLLP